MGIFLLLQPELHAGGAIYKVAIAFYDNPARFRVLLAGGRSFCLAIRRSIESRIF